MRLAPLKERLEKADKIRKLLEQYSAVEHALEVLHRQQKEETLLPALVVTDEQDALDEVEISVEAAISIITTRRMEIEADLKGFGVEFSR
jgi:hypothetical protein